MLARLNPFARLPNPREVGSWGVYDLANQSFQLLINSLLFSLFIAKVVVVDDPDRGRQVWGLMSAASLLLIALLSPIVGAIADQRAWKREMLLATGVVCAVLTATLALVQPGQLWLAVALYLVAAVACGLGENFLGSFLPEISTPRNVGYVSALGWTMSYIGALALLGITAAYTEVFDRVHPSQARPLFVFAGIWFAAGMIPAALWLRERATPQPSATGSIVGAAFRRLARSARESGQYRDLARFFLAFFVYSMGTLTVIFSLGLIGDELGFELPQLITLALVVALTAGVGSALAARYQDRVGHRRTIGFFLCCWVVATLAVAAGHYWGGGGSLGVFLIPAGVVGLALGGIGTSSRAIVGAFTPASRSAEFFGVWGMIYKLSGIVGVPLFSVVRAWLTLPVALVMVGGFFGAGLLLLMRVDEARGIAAGETARSA